MSFDINGTYLLYHKVTNYNSIEDSLRSNFDISDTCYIDLPIKDTVDNTVDFIMKINYLLSFCRGNIINFSRYIIYDEKWKEINTVIINPISTPYTCLELIPRIYIHDTQRFLSNAFKEYDKVDSLYMIRKIAREFPTTRNSATFLSSRSLILTAIIEYILFCFNRKIDNLELFNKNEYINSIEDIKKELSSLFEDKFGKKNKSKSQSIINKMDGLNLRTLNWKFQKFIKHYRLPINSNDIKKFKDIRDTLAHTLIFPEADDEIMDWKFLVNIIDKIIMGLFNYEGPYYNFYVGTDEYFKLCS